MSTYYSNVIILFVCGAIIGLVSAYFNRQSSNREMLRTVLAFISYSLVILVVGFLFPAGVQQPVGKNAPHIVKDDMRIVSKADAELIDSVKVTKLQLDNYRRTIMEMSEEIKTLREENSILIDFNQQLEKEKTTTNTYNFENVYGDVHIRE